jgi:two-component system, chemotaxis family, sensor histidine kinase and response regulator PixL
MPQPAPSPGAAFTHGVVIPVPQRRSSWLAPFIALLKTEIRVEHWLRPLKAWAGQRSVLPQPANPAPSVAATAAAPFPQPLNEMVQPVIDWSQISLEAAHNTAADGLSAAQPTLEDLFGAPASEGVPAPLFPPPDIPIAPAAAISEVPSSPTISLEPLAEMMPPIAEVAPPVPQPTPTKLRETLLRNTTVRVDLTKLEQLNYLTGELLINHNQHVSQNDYLKLMLQELLSQIQKHRQTLNELCRDERQHFANPVQSTGNSATNGGLAAARLSNPLLHCFDDLEMDRYSDGHILAQNALNEMIELGAIAEALNEQNRQHHHALEAQQRLLFLVGHDLTAIRMQPLEDLFYRLSQVVQQLATSHQKPVEVVLRGTEVLIDKTIVERLYDPLLHLVRNAFDHGIESPEVRQAHGKATTGRIEINAFHQGNQTIIQVKDDGPGIQLQRVTQRAIELGLLRPEAVNTTPASQLLPFLFESGFSTATQVSDLSGRGVGLDVVKTQIEELKGTISVDFIPQQGTTFSLQIPLSLTISKLLVCRHQGVTYALPLEAIAQIVTQPDQLTQIGHHQVLPWKQGDEITSIIIHPLASLIEYSEIASEFQSKPESSFALSIILLQTPAGLVGVQVDQVLGEQELVIRPLNSAIAPPAYVYGCSIIGNNQLALVVDIQRLLQQFSEKPFEPESFMAEVPDLPPTPAISATPTTPFHVLLVEDSLTLRRTLSQLLQRSGYQVSEAKDGLEALTFLQKQADVDLVICDIEMPRMSGFDFLSQRKQHPNMAAIPVVMLTSRSTEKYRLFALQLGASYFMTKPYADRELLSIVKELVIQP